MDSIELELAALHSANLSHRTPGHLLNYFKEELNDKLLINLAKDLDNLIETIDTNNSFKILSLNDRHDHVANTSARMSMSACTSFQQDNSFNSSQNSSLSSSLSEATLTSCKFLLAEISSKLCEIFSRYNVEIKQLIGIFERQQAATSSTLKVNI